MYLTLVESNTLHDITIQFVCVIAVKFSVLENFRKKYLTLSIIYYTISNIKPKVRV